MVSHPLEKCVTLKEHIMRLIKDGTKILDLDNIVETNHISYQTKRLSLIQFGSSKPAILYEHGLSSPTMQERFFAVNIFDKLIINMIACSELEEEADEENSKHENSLGEMDKTVAALEAMPMCLNWVQTFSLPNEMHQHMVVALKHTEFFTSRVNWGTLRENSALSVDKMTRASLIGVATSSKGLLPERPTYQ